MYEARSKLKERVPEVPKVRECYSMVYCYLSLPRDDLKPEIAKLKLSLFSHLS